LDGVTTLHIFYSGKTTCQLPTGVELAKAFEVNVYSAPEEILCEHDEKLEQTSPETDTCVPN